MLTPGHSARRRGRARNCTLALLLPKTHFSCALVCLAIVSSGASSSGETPTPVSFNRDVRPILSDNCFHCHGPDKQRSHLRLDVADVPLEMGAIIPGNPASSELVKRITSSDPEYRMPRRGSDRHLTPQQIATLTRWIAEGAEYERHWAFGPIPPQREATVEDETAWVKNPIDGFVLRRLQHERFTPRREADRERLLRRVTLDLTGRPPTLDELDAFIANESSDSYARVVDRLLSDSGYGEHMAVDWLDIARYADTHGYQDDKPSNLWPWRDWVIRAYNDNLPYDDFVRWQVAGDLLPSPTTDQLLATAFNRLHRQTNEGGSINEEFLAEYAADRAETFSTAFLGVTMGCARCHDHKFDPISQQDYYQLVAFFNNIDESGMYSFFTNATPTPNMFLYEGEQARKHQEAKKAVASAEKRLDTVRNGASERFQKWLRASDGEIALPKPFVHLPLNEINGKTTPNRMDDAAPAEVSGTLEVIEGKNGQAIRFSGENSISISGRVDFERTDPFTIAFWMKTVDGMDRMVVAHHSKASLDAASRGYEIFLDKGRVVAGLNHFWPGNALRVKTVQRVPRDTWVHVAVTYDGSSRAAGLQIYVDGNPVATDVIRDNLYRTIRYEGHSPPPLMLGARFRDPGFKNGAIDDFQVFYTRLSPAEVRVLAGRGADQPDERDLLNSYLARMDGPVIVARQLLWLTRRVENAIADSVREIMIMREDDSPASAHILARGEYDMPRLEVFPGTPDAILPYPDDYPRNRLGLAEWLLRRDHPLTARVAVNRMWKMFFGRGLVETAEDFGNQGSPPSHPELLDYLAAGFIDSGWDVKGLCRLIVSSATYRQDSTPTPEHVERDPANILLARGPRHRLRAEEIRDAALFASGLMVSKVGGPSVRPYQPEGLWKEASHITYSPDSGEGLYRRSMYTYIKRTVPPPMMLTFDATTREVCVARRAVTTTPLQALVLLNDPQFVEAARALAHNLLLDRDRDNSARLDEAFRLLTGRAPREEERRVLLEAYDEQLRLLAGDPAAAEEYVHVGDSDPSDSIDPMELAATTAVVQLIMNFEEFQVKL